MPAAAFAAALLMQYNHQYRQQQYSPGMVLLYLPHG
jgi:hypothetical protein